MGITMFILGFGFGFLCGVILGAVLYEVYKGGF